MKKIIYSLILILVMLCSSVGCSTNKGQFDSINDYADYMVDMKIGKTSDRIKNKVIISRIYGGWRIHILNEGYMFIPYDDFMKDYEKTNSN